MILSFTKMQGLGNDFVVIDAINQSIDLTAEQIKRLADRHYGIGCDQVLLVEPAKKSTTDFFYRIYNADGGEVGQCGNGARCLAKFIWQKHLSNKSLLSLETLTDQVLVKDMDGLVSVNLNVSALEADCQPLMLQGKSYAYTFVDVGNPHVVLMVDDVMQVPVESLGQAVNQGEQFPEGVNVEFMQVDAPSRAKIRTYERGVGETLACGSGAVAAAIAGILKNLLHNTVLIRQAGGDLTVEWRDTDKTAWMTGPAQFVFEGQVEI